MRCGNGMRLATHVMLIVAAAVKKGRGYEGWQVGQGIGRDAVGAACGPLYSGTRPRHGQVTRAQGPDVAAGRTGSRTAGASVAAKAGKGGLFGGRSLLVEWHGCMMSW